MSEDPLANVRSGLRRGRAIIGAYSGAAIAVYFGVYYWRSTVDPSFSVLLAYGYLAVGLALAVAVVWHVTYRVNPRILAFVQSLSGRMREADYAPWGMRKRGLLVTLDNGLLLTVSQNLVSFRLVFRPDGTVLRPTLAEWPVVLRGFGRAKRRAYVSSRKGEAWQKSELERVRGLLGSRSAVLVLAQQAGQDAANLVAGSWTALGMFFIRKWWLQGDAVRNACDDIGRLLARLKQDVYS